MPLERFSLGTPEATELRSDPLGVDDEKHYHRQSHHSAAHGDLFHCTLSVVDVDYTLSVVYTVNGFNAIGLDSFRASTGRWPKMRPVPGIFLGTPALQNRQ